MTDEEEDREAADVVARFRELTRQNDGVLISLIRDCLHYNIEKAVKAERERCLAIAASHQYPENDVAKLDGHGDEADAIADAIRKGPR